MGLGSLRDSQLVRLIVYECFRERLWVVALKVNSLRGEVYPLVRFDRVFR